MQNCLESLRGEIIKKGGLFFINPSEVSVRSYQRALIKNVMKPMRILQDVSNACGWDKPLYGPIDFKEPEGYFCSVLVRGKMVVATWRRLSPEAPQTLAAAAFLSFVGFAVNYDLYLRDVPDSSHCQAQVELLEDKKLVKHLMARAFPKLSNEERINNSQFIVKYSFTITNNEPRSKVDTAAAILALANRWSLHKFSDRMYRTESSRQRAAHNRESLSVHGNENIMQETKADKKHETLTNTRCSNLENTSARNRQMSDRPAHDENREMESSMDHSNVNENLDESRDILKEIEGRAEKQLSCYITYTKKTIAYIDHLYKNFDKLVSID